jgi:hypothetical protein
MLARADIASAVTPLDHEDLRGWHYVLTGGVLATLSPYGFEEGMTGRRAYLSDTLEGCAVALARLRLTLDAAGAAPESVAPLPDRSSQIRAARPADPLRPPRAQAAVAHERARSRLITIRWIWLVPSKICITLVSRM